MRFKTNILISLAFFATAAPVSAQPVIEVSELQALDGWASGGLRRGEVGFPNRLWAGSEAANVQALLARTPQSLGSPIAASLARRALISSGTAPVGDGAQDALRSRFEALGRLGMVEPLQVMVSGPVAQDPRIAQFLVQSDLAMGRQAQACRRADSLAAVGTTVFLARLQALCAALDGDAARADLAKEMARAAGQGDPWFFSALNALSAQAAGRPMKTPPAGKFDTTLNVAVSLAAGLKPGANALNSSSALALIQVARVENAPASLRYGAAVLGLRWNLIDAETARAAIRPSIAAAPAKSPPLAEALAALDAAASDEDRARVVVAALKRAESSGAMIATARLLQDVIAQGPRGSSGLSFSLGADHALMARAALVLGDLSAAQAWARSFRFRSGAVGDTTLGLALAILEGSDTAYWQGDRVNAALTVKGPQAALAAAQSAAARDLSLVASLGLPMPESAASFLAIKRNPPAGQRTADAALLAQMLNASGRGALGETALAAALILGDGAGRLDAASITSVVQALRQVGLEQDARRVVAEALTAELRW